MIVVGRRHTRSGQSGPDVLTPATWVNFIPENKSNMIRNINLK